MKVAFLAPIAIAAAALASSPVSAQVVHFQGSTKGCFGASCTPTGPGAADSDLVYLDGTFNQNTDPTGFLPLGGLTDNLGSFSLGGTAHTFTGDMFTLLVNFTAPGVTSGTFDATLKGIVTSRTNGGVFIDFDNTPQTFNYDGGSFTLTVNDVSVSSSGLAQILSGQIQAVPEPATWAMMLIGFGAIGFSMRSSRRKQTLLAQVA